MSILQSLTLSLALPGALLAATWDASPAFSAFYNLDYDRAVTLLEAQAAASPQDAGAHNHLAQALLYRALLRANALDAGAALSPTRFLNSPKPNVPDADRARFRAAIDASLRLSQGRGAEALYTAGVAHIHQANFEMFVNKSWRAALRSATAARHLHQQALASEPALTDARLIPATHDYIVGSLAWYLKAVGFLAGIRGDKGQGMEGVRYVAAHGRRTRVEANLLLALIARRDGQPARAAGILGELCRQFPQNYLYRMERIRALRAALDPNTAKGEEKLLRDYPNLPPARLRAFLGTESQE